MRRTVLTAVAVGAVALAAAEPADAQRYRWDFGINGGVSWYSDSLDDDDFFFFFDDDINGLLTDVDAGFKTGWLVGAQLTYWVPRVFGLEDRFGIRANFAYTERPFEFEFDFADDLIVNGFVTDFEIEDINLWSGTGDILFRFLGPDPTPFLGTEWLPYIALGAGAKWINPAADVAIGGVNGALVGLDGQFFLIEETTKFMGLIGLGTDIRLARRFALRAEVGDRIWDSPLKAVAINEIDDTFFIVEDDDVGNTINEIYATLGVHYLFGLAEPEEVAVAPPAPPAPPAEETIAVCVIDPNTYEVGYINAIFVPSTRDTLVALNGQRAPLSTVFPETAPLYVANAPWYTAGQPLTVTVQGMESEWVTFGGARVIEPADLVFLGTVRGTPVYASAADAAPIRADLEAARAEPDLARRLEMTAAARQAFENIDVVYVPLEIGCVFQALRRVDEVRKIRG